MSDSVRRGQEDDVWFQIDDFVPELKRVVVQFQASILVVNQRRIEREVAVRNHCSADHHGSCGVRQSKNSE